MRAGLLLLFVASCRHSGPADPPPLSLALRSGPVRLEEENLLYDVDLRGAEFPADWEVETGDWKATPAGLLGSIDSESAAVLWCRRPFPGDLAVRYWVQAVAPHENDANAFFRAAGRIYGTGDTAAWIAGIAGWHVFDDGLEKNPAGPSWRVPGTAMEDGKVVEIVAGGKGANLFLWKGGRLLLEKDDPAPLDPRSHDRIGLGTWHSTIRFLRVCVYRLTP